MSRWKETPWFDPQLTKMILLYILCVLQKHCYADSPQIKWATGIGGRVEVGRFQKLLKQRTLTSSDAIC